MSIGYKPEHEALANESDQEIAGRVRMLTRSDLDHELVCLAGRDRIMRLHYRVAELEKELAVSEERRKHYALIAMIYGPDDDTPDDEDAEPVVIDELPELDEKEKAVLDLMTPDFIDRVWRQVSERIACNEGECQRIDAHARSVASGDARLTPEQAEETCKRLVELLADFERMKRSAIEKWRRAIAAEKAIRAFTCRLTELHPGVMSPLEVIRLHAKDESCYLYHWAAGVLPHIEAALGVAASTAVEQPEKA